MPMMSMIPIMITAHLTPGATPCAKPSVSVDSPFFIVLFVMSEPSPKIFHCQPTEDEVGIRLDRFLHQKLPELSRSRYKELIKTGHVSLQGRNIEEPNHRVKPEHIYEVKIPAPQDADPEPENIPLSIIYEDDDVCVIDKPAGMVVHPASGNWSGTLVNALLYHFGDNLSGVGGVRRPGIVHRLDKDTSGLLVVTKNDTAHYSLSDQFASHGRDGRLTRQYQALVWGMPKRRKSTIHTQLARHPGNRVKIAVVNEGGKEAITHYACVKSFSSKGTKIASLVSCQLETGRTHQIRVHMAHIGHPLLGDMVYGAGFKTSAQNLSDEARKALNRLGRQALHASTLGFEHPTSGEKMLFESALPPSMQKLTDLLTHMA